MYVDPPSEVSWRLDPSWLQLPDLVVVNTVALIVSPGFWKLINPTILLPILLAELSLALWLLVKGIKVEAPAR